MLVLKLFSKSWRCFLCALKGAQSTEKLIVLTSKSQNKLRHIFCFSYLQIFLKILLWMCWRLMDKCKITATGTFMYEL